MHEFVSHGARIDNESVQSVHFLQPTMCPLLVCPTVENYEEELERHRATVATLRASARRERQLLRQKDELIMQIDILAKESEHRFLNGLQLINSLLTAQSRSTTNAEAAEQLNAAANRVGTLGRVNRHLHTLSASHTVKFKHYLEQLCADLSDVASGDAAGRSITVEGDEVEIAGLTAVPLGFVANELITNSIKYAKGTIAVRLEPMASGSAVLSVSDDGPGVPDSFDPSASTGLGMKIIVALLRQFNGELRFAKGRDGRGTTFSVAFTTGG